jgi:NADH:ubiquinone oxidoreductase subunit 6 (subunit J)
VYLLLPRPQPYPVLWGASAGGLALFLVLVSLIRWGPFSVENLLFFLFAASSLGFGTLLVTQHDPARAALSFAMVVLSTCGLYLLQAAPFLMAATIIIYAGAIIVTFLFVLMLSQQHGLSSADYRSREGLLSTIAGFVLLGSLLYVLKVNYDTRPLDEVLADVQRIRTEQKTQELFEDPAVKQKFLSAAKAALVRARPDVAADVAKEIDTTLTPLTPTEDPKTPDAAEQAKLLDKLEQILVRVRATTGDLQPRTEHPWPLGRERKPGEKAPDLVLSKFSGPPANAFKTPALDASRIASGVAPLPAENVVGLGRTLFTDYLLSVELGGTLLLVATIGAIAITGRRGERTI